MSLTYLPWIQNIDGFYEAADESPLRRNIYRININKGEPQKLSQQPGYNSATFSENGKYFVNNWSDQKHLQLLLCMMHPGSS